MASVTLNTGAKMPSVGLGLWKSNEDAGVVNATKFALNNGYQLFDGAAGYGNEHLVGQAMAEVFAAGEIKREKVFVVSKLFQTHHVWDGDPSRVHAQCDKTLKDLQLDYIDLYLMHWPFAFEQTDLAAIGGLRLPDGTPNPKLVYKMEYMETWNEMCKLLAAGKVKAIGVSNFSQPQLQEIIDGPSGVVPAVNQCEAHPYLPQDELRAFCDKNGIKMMAYSPLGSGDSYSGKSFPAAGTGRFECPSGGTTLLSNSVVNAIATAHGKNPGQVLIRWSIQKGFICIPKSVREERLLQNRAVEDWELTADDMTALAALGCDFRYGIGYETGHYDCPNAPWFGK